MPPHGAPLDGMRLALSSNPTLTLLKAYSRDWVLPLFAEHLEQVDGSVSAEWFHERVSDALGQVREELDWHGDRSPGEHCRRWIDSGWLETEVADGRTRYRLSPHSLRALRFVREITDGDHSVSGARLGSIAHAVRRLADMASPDRQAQARRIDEEIEQLTRRREDILAGRARLATAEQMQEQLREILGMTRSLPADFRQLRSMVEQRHKAIARHALAETPKAELVEEYLHDNDLLSRTAEGVAYRGFARMLSSSEEAETIRRDVDQVLAGSFARDHMSPAQREILDSMFSALLAAQLQVEQSYLRWTTSLRRIVTRAAHGRHARLISLAAAALEAAAEWADSNPAGRQISTDVLRIGVLAAEDISQTQLWRDTGPQTVTIGVAAGQEGLPASERAALRLAAGTSRREVARTIDRLLRDQPAVSGTQVYQATAPEFRRLGTLVSLLDLAVTHGRVEASGIDQVVLGGERERDLLVLLPRLVFDRPVGPVREDRPV